MPPPKPNLICIPTFQSPSICLSIRLNQSQDLVNCWTDYALFLKEYPYFLYDGFKMEPPNLKWIAFQPANPRLSVCLYILLNQAQDFVHCWTDLALLSYPLLVMQLSNIWKRSIKACSIPFSLITVNSPFPLPHFPSHIPLSPPSL